MTKSDLIKQFAIKKDLLTKDAETVVETIFEEITSSLENGHRVELRGFGSTG